MTTDKKIAAFLDISTLTALLFLYSLSKLTHGFTFQ